MLYIAGEDINADSSVVCGFDGKAYAAGETDGVLLGTAGAHIREGFRVCVRPDGQVYEDDA